METVLALIFLPIFLIGFILIMAFGSLLMNISKHPEWLLGGGILAALYKAWRNQKNKENK